MPTSWAFAAALLEVANQLNRARGVDPYLGHAQILAQQHPDSYRQIARAQGEASAAVDGSGVGSPETEGASVADLDAPPPDN